MTRSYSSRVRSPTSNRCQSLSDGSTVSRRPLRRPNRNPNTATRKHRNTSATRIPHPHPGPSRLGHMATPRGFCDVPVSASSNPLTAQGLRLRHCVRTKRAPHAESPVVSSLARSRSRARSPPSDCETTSTASRAQSGGECIQDDAEAHQIRPGSQTAWAMQPDGADPRTPQAGHPGCHRILEPGQLDVSVWRAVSVVLVGCLVQVVAFGIIIGAPAAGLGTAISPARHLNRRGRRHRGGTWPLHRYGECVRAE